MTTQTKTVLQQIILMVGIPGSGKTFEAVTQASVGENDYGLRIAIVSADHFFQQQGTYRFHMDMIGLAHMFCQAQAKMALRDGCDIVYVDNTNLSAWERAPYLELATIFGAEVRASVLEADVVECFQRQTHGVPYNRLEAMAKSMDLIPGEHILQAGVGRQVPVGV